MSKHPDDQTERSDEGQESVTVVRSVETIVLHNKSFIRQKFDKVRFESIEKCEFHACQFIGCIFVSSQLPKYVFETGFRQCLFSRCLFSHVRLVRVDFADCDFVLTAFNATAVFETVKLDKSSGLETCTYLDRVRVDESSESRLRLDESLRSTVLRWPERLASWERLRTFGRLPLFGASFSALVAIPSVAFGLAVYNEQIDRLRGWASRGDVAALWPPLGDMLQQLHPIPLPGLTFWLLVSTLLLGCASLIYSLLCPPRIKEFSLERWTDELRQTALHYLPFSWRHRSMRLLAGAFYLVGGIGTLAILVVKLWNAGEFIISNTTLPWYLW